MFINLLLACTVFYVAVHVVGWVLKYVFYAIAFVVIVSYLLGHLS